MVFLRNSLAAAAVFALGSAAPTASTTNLPLKFVSQVTNIKEVVLNDRARLAYANSRGKTSSGFAPQTDAPATNTLVSYQAPVSIGGKTWYLVVDTGSSLTWCGSRSSCEPTSNGRSTGGNIDANYGSGSWSGVSYTDKVVYGGLSVARQGIGAASQSTGFTATDGIIGFGPVGLTYGLVDNAYVVPTFMNNLYVEGSIANEVLGVYFKPENGSSQSDNNGALTLGGVDTTKYTGTLTYFPQLNDGSTSSLYWGILIAGFKYGSTSIFGAANAIVDTGTTLLLVPTNGFNSFLKLTGGTVDSNSGLAMFSKAPTQNFVITIGSVAYPLTPAQYLVPSADYAAFGLNKTQYYAWIGNGGDGSDGGTVCVIGQKFLEQYYSVFDNTLSRIGFAKRT